MNIVKLVPLFTAVAVLAGCGGGGSDATPSATPAAAPAPAQPELVTTLDAGGTLVTVNGGTLLYKKADGSVRMRSAAGVESVLQAPSDGASVIADTWQLSANNAFAFARKGTDATTTAVYRWKLDGSVSRLVDPAAPAGNAQAGAVPVVADYPFVVWSHGVGTGSSLAVHNLEANTFQYVGKPPTAEQAPNRHAARRSANNTLKLAFDARVKAGWTVLDHPDTDVYVWDSASAATTRVTSTEANLGPLLAGGRVIWRNTLSLTGSGPKLMSSALDGTDTRTLSVTPTSSNRMLHLDAVKDGTIAWTEGDLRSSVLKASTDGVSVTTVSTSPNLSGWFIAGAGHVFYNDGGVLYDWSAATGSKRLLDSMPAAMFVDDQTLFYVKSGTTQVWNLSLK